MPGLSVVDDDNGVGGPQASSLTFKHANFRQSAHQEICAWNPNERVQSLER